MVVSMQSKKKQITLKVGSRKPKIERAKRWPTVRKHHIQRQPQCQACGSKEKLEVHHIIPVHIDPSRELDPNNLLTLCENPSTGFCHYIFGHLSLSWWKYDPNVVSNTSSHHLAIDIANSTQDAKGRPANTMTNTGRDLLHVQTYSKVKVKQP